MIYGQDVWDIDDPFSPATDLNHALEVMQKLTKDPNVSVHEAHRPSLPVAICLAALSAKGVEFPAE